jgi:hypothetical protein
MSKLIHLWAELLIYKYICALEKGFITKKSKN